LQRDVRRAVSIFGLFFFGKERRAENTRRHMVASSLSFRCNNLYLSLFPSEQNLLSHVFIYCTFAILCNTSCPPRQHRHTHNALFEAAAAGRTKCKAVAFEWWMKKATGKTVCADLKPISGPVCVRTLHDWMITFVCVWRETMGTIISLIHFITSEVHCVQSASSLYCLLSSVTAAHLHRHSPLMFNVLSAGTFSVKLYFSSWDQFDRFQTWQISQRNFSFAVSSIFSAL